MLLGAYINWITNFPIKRAAWLLQDPYSPVEASANTKEVCLNDWWGHRILRSLAALLTVLSPSVKRCYKKLKCSAHLLSKAEIVLDWETIVQLDKGK